MNTSTTNPAAIASPKNSAAIADVNKRIRQGDRAIVEAAMSLGCDYWRMLKQMPKETFKAWLESQGKTLAEAKKLIRLFETFRDFALEKIERISLTTLFALTQKRYKQLLARLWELPASNEVQVQQLMAQERQKQEEKPERNLSGLVNLPTGGRAFQFPFLHDDRAICQLLQILDNWELTPRQLLIEAIALLHGKLQVLPLRQESEAVAI